jgi:SAM-dependent methyltransferase
MNAHVKVEGEIALQRSLADIVAEYDTKRAALAQAVKTFEAAGDTLKMAATVAGVYGDTSIDVGHVYLSSLEANLLKSGWKHVYNGLNIERLASPTDKRLWEQAIASPPPLTLDNIRGTFGKFLLDPRGNVLRGLAEVFCGLDDAYKSHDKVKIGVKGLPKRVILSGFTGWSGYGRDKVKTILNALAVYQGKPLVEYRELEMLEEREDALLKAGHFPPRRYETNIESTPGRGVRLKKFANGNGHLFFEPDTLRDINMALAEFYGDVLPDTPDENPKKAQSTAVSKDLQFYWTPNAVIDRIISDQCTLKGLRVLEPSCGDGRIMDALRKAGSKVYGVEVDAGRASICKAKGHTVLLKNFLETVPTGDFDLVFMNPPFYGKHYGKHVRHAYEFLKPDGKLIAILPATARYDHGLLDDLGIGASFGNRWSDLPVGSFSESGTNINTTVLTIYKR